MVVRIRNLTLSAAQQELADTWIAAQLAKTGDKDDAPHADSRFAYLVYATIIGQSVKLIDLQTMELIDIDQNSAFDLLPDARAGIFMTVPWRPETALKERR